MKSPWRLAVGLFSRKQLVDRDEPEAGTTVETQDPEKSERHSVEKRSSPAALDDHASERVQEAERAAADPEHSRASSVADVTESNTVAIDIPGRLTSSRTRKAVADAPGKFHAAHALDADIQNLRARLCEKLRIQNDIMTGLLARYK
jgi:hypothetical protein